MNANGQVFLINSNGVLFSPGAQVNVGGLVASTLNLSTKDFMAGNYRFDGDSAASVSNQGDIKVGAGSKVRLDLGGPVKIEVQEAVLNTIIEQGRAIRADGGLVYLMAKAAGPLSASVINHTGITEARSLAANAQGDIYLIGDMTNGTLNVAGTLDAGVPAGVKAGFIETSAQHVKVADETTIKVDHWLIDPYDFTIAAAGGDITGSALSAALGGTNVTIETTSSSVNCTGVTGCGAGTAAGNGDIFVNDAVTWNAASKLTLSAHRNIDINADITAQNANGQLQLDYGQGAAASGNTASYNLNGGTINLQTGDNFSTTLGSDGDLIGWKVITSLGNEGSTTGTDLQGINGHPSDNYVQGANIDASDTSSWDSGKGFMPIGLFGAPFDGRFDGLRHTINDLTINRPATSLVGLFGSAQNATMRNIGLVGGSVTGDGYVGGLVGYLAVDTGVASVRNTLWDTMATGIDAGIGGQNNSGGTITLTNASGKTTAQMQTITPYNSGGATWDIVGDKDYTGSYLYPRLSMRDGSPVWLIKPTSVFYTLSSLSDVYQGRDYLLTDYWDTPSIFDAPYSSWVLGTDYTFQYGRNTVAGFANAGTYRNIGINIFKDGFIVAGSGNTAGEVTIIPAPLIITANDASKTYDSTAYTGGNGVKYTGFVGGQGSGALGCAHSSLHGGSGSRQPQQPLHR